jgi:hypothetical protein
LKCVSINFFCCQKDDKKRHVGPVTVWMLLVGAFKKGSSVIGVNLVGFFLPGSIKESHNQTGLSGLGNGSFRNKHWKLFQRIAVILPAP